ncbi:restriction endonuclease subunit S [Prevotella lacticifex]|uniref:Type I restriction modification DNA specificity domain-containing protein n=1 Tax=Prevotella lacticifex TaxID=2854755 RepID=A0A9R1C7G9_9BACT|nr:restriction endonuclease subunit S [Prevotella lacticifex]GJG37180.1 hypothetical protein PRLR5003_23370 [Prevotella lacticifex]GJG40320.1 hypothetical protein PRLR5019_22910 [Prevotella lacticifex]GJG44017.1 hypothetical protein PRLR5025_28030 [Prevotella lacticifex]GJG46701.1 hypothetical protein PRLR5027_22960 [Prevotella lacticifex]GJG50679.1 hypothetical protein PRLR5052_30920 [Prevotella lacticifex]
MTSYKRLGEFIEPIDERNSDLKVKLAQGINNNKYFQAPKQVATNSRADKIVRTGYFAYNRATTRNGDKISIAYRQGPDCTVSSAYQVFRIKNKKLLNPKYLMMWYKRPDFDRYALYMSKGSAHEFFNWEEMCDVMLPVPSIDEQNRIVAEYEAIDNRISVNKRIIEKLEQTAMTLYRHTFVEGIDQDNPPEGWEVGHISDLGEIVSGATPSTEHPEYWTNDGIHWLSPADLSKQNKKFISRGDRDITEAGYKSASTRMLPTGSVLFSSRAPIGLLGIAVNEVCTNQGFKSIIPKKEIGNGYVYYTLKHMKEMIASQNTGSTFAEVSGKTLGQYSVVLPPQGLLVDFQSIIEKLFRYQYSLEKEISILSTVNSLRLNSLEKK